MTQAARPWRIRPMPEDFAERASSGVTINELMLHYGAGASVMRRWLDEYGKRPRAARSTARRGVPEDFGEWASVETVLQLIKRYCCGTATVTRWRRELGLKPVRSRQKKPTAIPDGFALVAPVTTMRELKQRYGKGKTTIWKWCQIAGVQPRTVAVSRTQQVRPARNPAPAGRKLNPFDGPHRDTTRAGMAADYLRKFGPVVRCDAAGRFNPTGNHWRRGSTILCADEVIARAIRNGWNPDAWKALAA
jgi:hypothetical protein